MSDVSLELIQSIKSLSDRVDSLSEKIIALADSMDKEFVFTPEKYEVKSKEKVEENMESVMPVAMKA